MTPTRSVYKITELKFVLFNFLLKCPAMSDQFFCVINGDKNDVLSAPISISRWRKKSQGTRSEEWGGWWQSSNFWYKTGESIKLSSRCIAMVNVPCRQKFIRYSFSYSITKRGIVSTVTRYMFNFLVKMSLTTVFATSSAVKRRFGQKKSLISWTWML